jgi:hypothetical protein
MRVGVEEATVIEIELVLQSKRYMVSHAISYPISLQTRTRIYLSAPPRRKGTIRASWNQAHTSENSVVCLTCLPRRVSRICSCDGMRLACASDALKSSTDSNADSTSSVSPVWATNTCSVIRSGGFPFVQRAAACRTARRQASSRCWGFFYAW